jgi:hypothetical protein
LVGRWTPLGIKNQKTTAKQYEIMRLNRKEVIYSLFHKSIPVTIIPG